MRSLNTNGVRPSTRLLIGGSIALLMASTPVRAGQPVEMSERDSLRGLTGIEVHMEPLPIEIEELGLPSWKLQNEVQQHLQKAGINVLTEGERLAGSTTGLLGIHVEAAHDRISRFFYTIHLSLKRRVRLEGLDPPEASAVTWMKLGTVGSMADDNVTYLQEQVLRKVDQFIKDYRAVNPNRKGSSHRAKP